MIGDSRPVSLEVQAGDGRVSSDKAVSVELIVIQEDVELDKSVVIP